MNRYTIQLGEHFFKVFAEYQINIIFYFIIKEAAKSCEDDSTCKTFTPEEAVVNIPNASLSAF